jgi:hypothetical protein
MRFLTFCRFVPLALVATFLLTPQATGLEDDDGFKPLFNGKDLTGFKTFLDPKAKDADPANTWSVTEGYIRCTGKPNGYFYTDKSYKNYVLRYDWRFPAGSAETSNSGCLVHIQPPQKVWPRCVEAQGLYRDHGKFIPVGLKKDEYQQVQFDAEALKKALKPMGEWSTTEISCKPDGTVSVKVNGVPVSSGKSVLTEGQIGWQSEGAEIHFRNLKIKELKGLSRSSE